MVYKNVVGLLLKESHCKSLISFIQSNAGTLNCPTASPGKRFSKESARNRLIWVRFLIFRQLHLYHWTKPTILKSKLPKIKPNESDVGLHSLYPVLLSLYAQQSLRPMLVSFRYTAHQIVHSAGNCFLIFRSLNFGPSYPFCLFQFLFILDIQKTNHIKVYSSSVFYPSRSAAFI